MAVPTTMTLVSNITVHNGQDSPLSSRAVSRRIVRA